MYSIIESYPEKVSEGIGEIGGMRKKWVVNDTKTLQNVLQFANEIIYSL